MFNAFLNLIFPSTCQACRQPLQLGETLICTHCLYELPKTNSHLGEYPSLELKLAGRLPLKHTLAYLKFNKGGKVQKLIHSLKYRGNQAIGEKLGKMYGYALAEKGLDQEFDLLIPVPLHPIKMIQRGYNQCDSFTKGLAESMQVGWSPAILKRGKLAESQTKKSRIQRFIHMEDIFYVDNYVDIVDKRVAIIDDVITTGATLEACGIALLEKGVKELSVITIATAL